MTFDDLRPVFCDELVRQELDNDTPYIEIPAEIDGWELLQAAGRKRGFLVSGGEVNTERMAKALMDDYRSGKLGKLTLESPEDMQ